MKLTRSERKAIFDGTLKVLRRPKKPDQEAGHQIVVSKTRGGKQIVDRDSGETIDMPTQPRLWITIKGWHLKAGEKEWQTDVTIYDLREQNRVLSNGLGGIPREPGLKTRWGTKVVHNDGKVEVRPKRVPTKAEQRENWTPETERGYGGRNGMERSVDGDLVPATGVDDGTIKQFLAPKNEGGRGIEKANIGRRLQQRKREEGMRREMKLAGEHRRTKRQQARAAVAKPTLDVMVVDSDGSAEEIAVEIAA